jgi:hypothetical protein
MNKIIFLDIDGVLNDHKYNKKAQSSTLKKSCVKQLNRIIAKTGAKIVLSSAWRYMIFGGAVTLVGMQYLFRTHGAVGWKIIGTTCKDELCTRSSCRHEEKRIELDELGRNICPKCKGIKCRGNQIYKWLKDNGMQYFLSSDSVFKNFVILDDMDEGMYCSGRLVQTNPKIGLTRRKADQVIKMLLES